MAQWSFPFQDVDGDRMYSDKDFADYYATLFKDGVTMPVGNALQVVQSSGGGMNLIVKSGGSILKGRVYLNTDDLALSVPVASNMQDRIDSIVVRLDITGRQITLAYKQGNTSVERTDLVWELQLATITVPRNAVNITNANITDKRADDSVCGYSSPFEKVSVSGLEQQYEAMLQQAFDSFQGAANDNQDSLEQLLTDQNATFQQWLSNLQSQLDDNQAGNIQNQLDDLTPNAEAFTIIHNLGYYPTVQVLAWKYGLGTVPLDEQPDGISWDGEAPYSIPFKTEYWDRNKVKIYVPIGYKLNDPIVTLIKPNEFLLNEGINSLSVRIVP